MADKDTRSKSIIVVTDDTGIGAARWEHNGNTKRVITS
jgi:hypothetical protein